MALLAPMWLFALVPWAAVSVWLWVGRRRRHWVPFLPLWDAPQELRRPKRGVEPPPLGLLLAILAMLAGVLAMTRPVYVSPADRGPVTIVVDRGASMSAQSAGKPRFAQAAQTTAPPLLARLGPGPVELIDVLTGATEQTDRADWAARVARWKRTALDTRAALQSTVRQHLAMNQTVIALTDQDLDLADPKLVTIAPTEAVHNTAIIALAQRPGQVMATLHATDAKSVTLHLRAGDRTADARVDLAANADQNVFVNLDAAGADTIEAWLDATDDFDADDRAYLVRQRDWATIEPRVPLSDELRRMIAVYTRHRPPGAASTPLPLARPGELKPDERGVLLAPVAAEQTATNNIGSQAHALTAGVDLAATLGQHVAVADRGPGEGWQRLAWIGDKTILAVRSGENDNGARQVWVGFDSPDFARTPDFVLFWTNVFDWLAGGSEGFTSSPVGTVPAGARRLLPAPLSGEVEASYWPGVFETPTGKLAADTGPVPFRVSADRTWPDALTRLHLTGPAARSLAPTLAIAALLLLLGAAWRWERRRAPKTGPVSRLAVEEGSVR